MLLKMASIIQNRFFYNLLFSLCNAPAKRLDLSWEVRVGHEEGMQGTGSWGNGGGAKSGNPEWGLSIPIYRPSIAHPSCYTL